MWIPAKAPRLLCIAIAAATIFGAAAIGDSNPNSAGLFRASGTQSYKPGYWDKVPTDIRGLDISSIEYDNATVGGIVRRFKNLQYLNISDTEVDDHVFEQLPSMPTLLSLESMLLAINGTGLKHFNKFPHLAVLSLHNTTVRNENLKYLMVCPELSNLRLSDTPTDERGCAEIARLPKLRSLDISKSAINDKAMAALYPLHNTLQYLDISRCDISDVGLKAVGKLEHLENLCLRTARIPATSAKSIQSLQGLKALRSIAFDSANIQDDVLESLSKNLPQLNTLDVQGCKLLTDKGFSSLRPMAQLKNLNAGDTKVGDGLMRAACNWKQLNVLKVGGGNIGNEGIRAFVESKSPVTVLSIDNCKIDDKGIVNIAKLPKLEVLSLNGDNITDASVPVLTKLKSLTGLGLRDTKVTADGAARIRKALPKCHVFI
jgi:Leucine-rich repeat (LRR) protein